MRTEQRDTFSGYFNNLNRNLFFNLAKENPASRKYMFFKVQMFSADKFAYYTVTENIDEKFYSSEALKTFVMRNMQNSYFFEKEEAVFVRMK